MTPLILPYSYHRWWKNARNVTYWKRERDPWTEDSLTHHPLETMTVSTSLEHVSNLLVVSTQQCWKCDRSWGHGTHTRKIKHRLVCAMITPGSWATRIHQTREQGHQADNTDDDDCFYYHSWRNNVVTAFGTLDLALHSKWRCLRCLSFCR